MSYLQRKSNSSYGIGNYLRKNGFEAYNGKQINNFMIMFLRHSKLPYKDWNNRYKGLNTPDLINAELVQDNFTEFKKFIKLLKDNEKE